MTEYELNTACNRLKMMRLGGMAEELRKQNNDVNIGLVSPDERILRMIEAESDLRAQNKFCRTMKQAHLRHPSASITEKTLNPERCSSPDTVRRLAAEKKWITDGKNLIITGLTGCGKSSLACALAVAAMGKSLKALYKRTSDLLDELDQARQDGRLRKRIQELNGMDMLILDDFGMVDMTLERIQVLFELLEAREGRKTTVYVSQIPVGEWYGLFPDSTYADACMDRILCSAYRVELWGESMRSRDPEQPPEQIEEKPSKKGDVHAG